MVPMVPEMPEDQLLEEHGIDVRWDDESQSFWVPAGYNYRWQNSEELPELMTAEGLQTVIQKHEQGNPFFGVQYQIDYRWHQFDSAHNLAQLPGRHLGSNKEQREQAIRQVAAEVIYCDGRVWNKAPEPCWRVEMDWRFPTVKLIFANDEELRKFPDTMYRADCFDDAMADLEAQVGEFDSRDSYAPRARGAVDVYRSDLLQMKFGEIQLKSVCKRAMERIKGELYQFPRDFILAYVDLRDDLAGLGETSTMEDALASAEKYLEELVAINEADDYGRHKTSIEELMKSIGRYVEETKNEELDILRELPDLR